MKDTIERIQDPLKIVERIGPYTFSMSFGPVGIEYRIAVDEMKSVDGREVMAKVEDVVKREAYVDALATVRTSALERLSAAFDPDSSTSINADITKIGEQLDPGLEDTFARQLLANLDR